MYRRRYVRNLVSLIEKLAFKFANSSKIRRSVLIIVPAIGTVADGRKRLLSSNEIVGVTARQRDNAPSTRELVLTNTDFIKSHLKANSASV
jgi:hypothetical protein